MSTTKLNLLTFNVWGLDIPIITKNKAERLEFLPSALCQHTKQPDSDVNVICLQELFRERDFKRLREDSGMEKQYPFGVYYPSGMIGSGLAIFSSHRLEDVDFMAFRWQGYPERFWHGDYYAGKGVAFAKISVKSKLEDQESISIGIFNTHLHAEYNHGIAQYGTQRLLQTLDLIQFMREKLLAHNLDCVFLGGDLNLEDNDPCYQLLIPKPLEDDSFLHWKRKDAWMKANGTAPDRKTALDWGKTHNRRDSSFRGPGGSSNISERLDYIIYGMSRSHAVECTDSKLEFTGQLVPFGSKLISLSDHVAVTANFEITRTMEQKLATLPAESFESDVVIEKLCSYIKDLERQRAFGLFIHLPLCLIGIFIISVGLILSFMFISSTLPKVIISLVVCLILIPVLSIQALIILWKSVVRSRQETNLILNHYLHGADLRLKVNVNNAELRL